MRSKASARREKDLRISLGDRLVVAQKLENKEITAKEAQELLRTRRSPPRRPRSSWCVCVCV
eukprot:2373007-Rhodomonas_salina.2